MRFRSREKTKTATYDASSPSCSSSQWESSCREPEPKVFDESRRDKVTMICLERGIIIIINCKSVLSIDNWLYLLSSNDTQKYPFHMFSKEVIKNFGKKRSGKCENFSTRCHIWGYFAVLYRTKMGQHFCK